MRLEVEKRKKRKKIAQRQNLRLSTILSVLSCRVSVVWCYDLCQQWVSVVVRCVFVDLTLYLRVCLNFRHASARLYHWDNTQHLVKKYVCLPCRQPWRNPRGSGPFPPACLPPRSAVVVRDGQNKKRSPIIRNAALPTHVCVSTYYDEITVQNTQTCTFIFCCCLYVLSNS